MRHCRPAALFELEVEEAEVEAGVVRDQRRVLNEGEQLFGLVGEGWLVRQEDRRQAMHRLGFERHVAPGIEIGMKVRPVSTRLTISMQPISTMRSPPEGFSPVVSVSKTISRMRRIYPPAASPRQARISATCASVVDRSLPVSMTKSARRALLRVGHLAGKDRIELRHAHAGARRARARAGLRPARKRRRPCRIRVSPPVSNRSGISKTRAGLPRCSATNASRASRTAGWTIRSSAASFRGRQGRSRPGIRGRASRSARSRGIVRRSCRPDAPPGAWSCRTTASASNTGMPARSNIFATVDLPMPIDPVSAMRIMPPPSRAREARRAAAATACRES